MAFDVIFARAVAGELDKALRGARVEKIYQPSREELVLSCRTGRETQRLLISCSPSSARTAITAAQSENPASPPMLCMLLRKHLTGALLRSVGTVGFERAVIFSFEAHDELGFPRTEHLIAEIMGKYSNVIFTVGDNADDMKILGAMKNVDFTTSRLRQVLPGMKYEAPPSQNKASPLDETEAGFSEKFAAYPPEKDASRFFIETYSGFSPAVAEELAYRAGCDGKCAADVDVTRLYKSFKTLMDAVKSGDYVPCLAISNDGKPIEYSYTSLTHFDGCTKIFGSFSELLGAFYGEKAALEALKNRAGATEALVASAVKKLTKKISILSEELAECDEADKYRLWGELLTSSLYKLGGRAKSAIVDNYFTDPMTVVTVPLDEKYSPAQNAARYYKKYAKLKTQKEIAAAQLEKTRAELDYLATVKASLLLCECEADVSEIRAELAQTGYIKTPAKGSAKAPKIKKSEPMKFVTSGGREFFCGKNNTQNDFLTLKFAEKSDFWFHVKGGAGSHVIMKCEPGEEPDARDFTEAAQAAAYFSGESQSEKVEVDYTRVKFVRKPSGSAPGHVIYTDYHTAYVSPARPAKFL